MTKKKKSRKIGIHSSKKLLYFAVFLATIALILISVTIGYYFGLEDTKEQQHITQKKHPQTRENVPLKKALNEILEKEQPKYISAAHEIQDEALVNPPKKKEESGVDSSSKPKLAIIIDDVQTARDVRVIKALDIPVTMSFLPPRRTRPNSAKLASREKFYMVHLPMEALHFSAEEPETLHVGDSQQKILNRVAEIKREFPRVRYINNHTGSKFTSDITSVKRLIYALKKNNILFIDSRTTAKTKVPQVEKADGLKYVARDVFLDHSMDKAYVKKQIKVAIRVAKENGSAIAIGHPHRGTLEAIRESKALFKDVDLVQVYQVY